jgi:DNA-binding transcriptional ArsR family regulator
MDRDDAALDLVFAALADPTRRGILDRLAVEPGATTGDLATVAAALSRFAVMKHLEVLRRAGLVQTLPEGRRRRHYPVSRAFDPPRAWLERRVSEPGVAG